MLLPYLDDTCQKLFSALFIRSMRKEEPIRFNKLYDYLNEKDEYGNVKVFKISKPTLSLHLNHLVEKELIKRTQVAKQHVEYSFHDDKWLHLKEFAEDQMKFKKFFEEERESFDSDTPLAQVGHVGFVLVLRSLIQLKCEMLKIIEPENQFEYNTRILSYSTLWDNFRKWLLHNVYKSDENAREEFLTAIEKCINLFQNTIFQPKKGSVS